MTTIAARPTTYRGIEMRSRLEATFAGFLDRCEFGWEYEPRAFGGSGGQYLPDFAISGALTHESPFYVEVKAVMPQEGNLWSRMAIIWESEPSAAIAVVPREIVVDGEKWRAPRFGFPARYSTSPIEFLYAWGLCGACGKVTVAEEPPRWICRDEDCWSTTPSAFLDPFKWAPKL